MTLTVFGHGDVIRVVGAAVAEEFRYASAHREGDILGFPEGTVLGVERADGVWRIRAMAHGSATVAIGDGGATLVFPDVVRGIWHGSAKRSA